MWTRCSSTSTGRSSTPRPISSRRSTGYWWKSITPRSRSTTFASAPARAPSASSSPALDAQGAERPDDATLRSLIERLIACYFEIETQSIQPFPAVVSTIERLREAGVSLAVCTNRGERSTRRLLAHFDLDRHIEAVLAGDMVARIKPDPGHVREALAALGAAPARAVMVGDSAADVESAQGAGVAAIVAAYGYSPIPPHDLGAEAVIDDFGELPVSIERLFRA